MHWIEMPKLKALGYAQVKLGEISFFKFFHQYLIFKYCLIQ